MTEPKPSSLYEALPLAELYDQSGRARPDFEACRDMAGPRVLDLGCGTGAFAASLGETRDVVGVDVSAAMLDVAAARPGGDQVTWVQGDARSVRLDARFDLIVLTGHSFQVFLNAAAQLAVLQTIAAHLASHGQFIFDSRNPGFPGHKGRTADETRRDLQTEKFGEVEMWNSSAFDASTGILSYENQYRITKTGAVHRGSDRILYTPVDQLDALCTKAGLRVTRKLGDWDGQAFTPAAPEIILIGGLA